MLNDQNTDSLWLKRTYIDKFYKTLTANDLGKTGSHQAGIAIPKNKSFLGFWMKLS